MKTPQRLVLCLDGTWNNRDDSTNVLHQSVLSLEGGNADGFFQRIYYDEGVGNGVLDGVTGGGFGIGLEENVREAYNWLIEYFNDTTDPKYAADEIYVFGFSRGAYTARSLVGFIGRCGLLRRGSPLTVNELWSAYCLLGRQHEGRTSVWDSVAGELAPPFREITQLTYDPWSTRKGVPNGADPLCPAERLLVAWSRRVRITYLGLYDTVGAMGLDALAIPGLRSRVALHHNMRPTTLIQQCRHVLAIDEHRRSFQHTPFVAYYGHARSERELERAEEGGADTAKASRWQRTERMWTRKIEQRWFIGAHSNVGGGYASNTLAQLPFAWVLEGAIKEGLKCEPFPSPLGASAAPLPAPHDSYAAFAAPLGTHLLRLKRNYRVIAPPDDIRAARPDATDGAEMRPGFTLKSIHETVDPSVLGYYQAAGRALPANLARIAGAIPIADKPVALKCDPSSHAWPHGGLAALAWTPLWGALAAVGVQAASHFFSGGVFAAPSWLLVAAALLFVIVDWCESRLNFALAHAATPAACMRAAQDSIYWTRALGVVFAFIGIAGAATALLAAGWAAPTLAAAWTAASLFIVAWWPIVAAGALGTLVCAALDHPRGWRLLAPLGAAVAGGLAMVALVGAAHLSRRILGIAPSMAALGDATTVPAAVIAGQLLLLQVGCAYFWRAFSWVGEPLGRIGLPSIGQLQFCAKPAPVFALLRGWHKKLVCDWREDPEFTGPAAQRMRATVQEALWRDIIGFIPVYGLVLGYGLWLASRWLVAPCPVGGWLNTSLWHEPLWLWIILIAVAADWIEDALHLRYLAAYAQGKPPSAAQTWPAFLATLVKFAAFGAGCLASVAALVAGALQLFRLETQIDWRGSLALLVSLGAASAVAAVVLMWLGLKHAAPRWKNRTRGTGQVPS